MILITESTSKKLPGNKSIFLKADYNQELIEFIHQLDAYHWDKKELTWELPINCLSKLLDKFCYFDEIKINLLKNTKNNNTNKRVLNYKTKPFDYQLDGINYGLNHNRWLLLDAPGLGKSLQMIYLAEELKMQKQIEHCLIICGVNTLKSNWAHEIKKHSTQDSIIIGEKINSKGNKTNDSIPERAKQLKSKIDEFFIIVNIETLRSKEIIDAIKNSENKIDMIVFDECHTAKSSQSLQGKNLLKLKANYMIAMTGTLIMNNPLDAYVPLTWIGENNSSLTNFKSYFCRFGGFNGYQVIGFKNLDRLKDMINDCSLRRTKDLLNLPTKNIINEYVDMNSVHKQFYDNVKNGIKEEVDKIELKTATLLGLVTRLRQATACPSILTSNEMQASKLVRAKDLAEQIISQGDKVVIFNTFKESAKQLVEMLKEYKPLLATGDQNDQAINEAINEFQNNCNNKILVATWQKMGVGITLTAASYVIFIDTPWTSAVYTQAQDRIYRIGTDKPVFIYNLICKDTIDERVLEIVSDKEVISDYIVDDKLTERSIDVLKKYVETL